MQRCHWLFCHFEVPVACPQGPTSSQHCDRLMRFATPLAAQELPPILPFLPCPSEQLHALTLFCQLRLKQAQARPDTFFFFSGVSHGVGTHRN